MQPVDFASETAELTRNQVLQQAGRWLTREDWEERCQEHAGLGRARARAARTLLRDQGMVAVRESGMRAGRRKELYAPREDLRPAGWEAFPGEAEEDES